MIRDLLALLVFGGFVAWPLRRVLPRDVWEFGVLAGLLGWLVLVAAFADQIDGPPPVDVAGEP